MDDLPSVRIMDEASLVRLFNIISDELQLLPCAFRLWAIGVVDKTSTHRIVRVLDKKDWELPVENRAKRHVLNVYVEILPKEKESGDVVNARARAYRDIRAREKQWLEALRMELTKLPPHPDVDLVMGTSFRVGAGGGGSTDAPSEKDGSATAPLVVAAAAAEIDPTEGCGIGSSNVPLDLLTWHPLLMSKKGIALDDEMKQLNEEMLTWMKRYCVDTNANASIMFFKAYDPHNLLPSRRPTPSW